MNINYDLMKQICLAPIEHFEHLGQVTTTQDGIYILHENPHAKILGVAHLDTVKTLQHFHKIDIAGDDLVFNSQLDDRLGVYVMLDILPKLGIEFDLLLTEGEESGRSTAAYFETEKSYNWMFSFDRHGEDVVMYQYDDKPLRKMLEDSKFKPSIGSFSDICFLDHLGIKGINIGTGYEGEHSNTCYADMSILQRQITRFTDFYRKHKDCKLEHIQKTSSPIPYPVKYNWSEWEDYDGITCYLCNRKRGTNQIFNDLFLCDQCFGEAGQCEECGDIVYQDELMDGVCMNCEED